MTVTDLYQCFEQHLLNLDIEKEEEQEFVTSVVEFYLVDCLGKGYHFINEAEDTYLELCDEVVEMLRKKIYGHMSIDQYRQFLRKDNNNN